MHTRLGTFAAALLLMIPAVSFAQMTRTSRSPRVWVDVNFGIANSAAEETTFEFPFTLFLETATLSATYPPPSRGSLFDIGGGYMFTGAFGVGVSYVRASHDDVVGLRARIPHPDFFNAFGTGLGETDSPLDRSEGTINISAVFVPVRTDRIQVRVFGGPSFFSYTADMVQDIQATQVSDENDPFVNVITIQDFVAEQVKGTGTGFHIGGDFGYFFTDMFGVGAVVRYSRGTVSIDEPLSEETLDVRVGGTQIAFGVRLRFGR